jgi:hypothetical protein
MRADIVCAAKCQLRTHAMQQTTSTNWRFIQSPRRRAHLPIWVRSANKILGRHTRDEVPDAEPGKTGERTTADKDDRSPRVLRRARPIPARRVQNCKIDRTEHQQGLQGHLGSLPSVLGGLVVGHIGFACNTARPRVPFLHLPSFQVGDQVHHKMKQVASHNEEVVVSDGEVRGENRKCHRLTAAIAVGVVHQRPCRGIIDDTVVGIVRRGADEKGLR